MELHIRSNKMLLYKKDSVPADSAAIICSSYPVNEERFDWLPLKLILYFDDITDARRPCAFTTKISKAICDFVVANENKNLYICCDSGESRSAAIAAAICRSMEIDEMWVWRSPHYHPNPLVYKIQCESFGMPVRKEEIAELRRINAKALAAAVTASRIRVGNNNNGMDDGGSK